MVRFQRKATASDKDKHIEAHFTASDLIKDIVIGMADGLTVPFALAAGLSGTLSNSNLVVVAGFAEIAAGSIAMGLGGYLAARTDHEHYMAELERERFEIVMYPEKERQEVADILHAWNLPDSAISQAVDTISKDPDRWIDFMMKHELGLEKPEPKRARNSSLTIGLSYIIGGIIPLAPYIMIARPEMALIISAVVTLLALFGFGYVKGRFTGSTPFKSAWQTMLVGGLAAGFAYLISKWIA
ncbi:VIT1/CCC1 transporter family protein [Paenibacillus glycinis]|uniref:Iron transporter n=1 Tax=Paenibacillus glycinis TaxID=2697035 RepID=A0ABW9XQW4_9BACL|nr:VIT1/CCC1 transporter family protein [Paenibacillus glycinis]NBD25010.1 iron transporter [Paenibacillus glycinis]